MKNKILKIIKNKKYIMFISIVVFLISLFLLFSFIFKGETYTYQNNEYFIQFDSNWKSSNKSSSTIKLSHGSGSIIDINIIKLEDDNKEKSLEIIVENLEYLITSENKSYKLIYEQFDKITSKNYEGYKILYENDSDQTLVVVGKKADQIFIINYSAPSKFFDILLNSVQKTIDSFYLKNEQFNVMNINEIESSNINYSKDNDICDYSNKKEYEVFDNRYHIVYEIPECFITDKFDTTSGYYSFNQQTGMFARLTDPKISISFKIHKINQYDYLNSDNSLSLPKTIESFKKIYENTNPKNYITTIENDKKDNMYIYKIDYKETLQEINISQPLDNIITLVISIKGNNIGINENMINNIKIKSIEKYGKNINRSTDKGYLIDNLKVFVSETNFEYYYNVRYNIPDKYIEDDIGNNKYISRVFYNEKYNDEYLGNKYKYHISVELDDMRNIDDYITLENNYLNKNQIFNEESNLYMNDILFRKFSLKTFDNDNNLISNTIIMLANLDVESKGIYKVTISSSDNVIPDNIIKDFTNVSISKIKTKK